jgi:hypothetical protein
MTHFDVSSPSTPTGPRAWMRLVLMPTSAPSPNLRGGGGAGGWLVIEGRGCVRPGFEIPSAQRVCAYTHARTSTHTHTHTHTQTNTHTHARTHARAHKHTYAATRARAPEAVAEPRRRVVEDARAVDARQKRVGRRRILGHDHVGVAAAVRVDVVDGVIQRLDGLEGDAQAGVLVARRGGGRQPEVGPRRREPLAGVHLAGAGAGEGRRDAPREGAGREGPRSHGGPELGR